ncbi:retrovirus-related pol polyprotein from transposon TNT 1-94 [Tanacetum coccineum]
MDEGTQNYSLDHKLAGTNPSVLVDKTKFAGDGLKTAHADSDLMKDTRSALFTPDSPQDEPIIVSYESEEKETKKDKDTHTASHDSQKEKLEQQKVKAEAEVASLKARPSYLDINQLTELLVTSLKPKLSKLLASHDFASSMPNELKELPSKITTLSGEIQELKRHVQGMEIELPAEFLALPIQISSVQAKLQTLDTLPSLLNNVVDTLTRFESITENASKGVPSAGPTTTSPAEEEKNTNPTTKDAGTKNLHNKLIYLLGIDIVTRYYNKKLLYEKYCDKMLKRRKSSKIINCDVLTQKGPIIMQIYREDGTIEVISNVKVSDLHLAEWREVVQACPHRKEKGWKTIYGLIKKRMEYLNQTEKELKIEFNKPLKEQDPLNELNDLADKKRKRTSDSKDHSRSTKKHKSSIQHEEEGSSVSDLHVLRILGSIFTSFYASDQKLKKAYKVYKARKRLLYVKRNKAISLRKTTFRVGIEVQQLFLKGRTDHSNNNVNAEENNNDQAIDAHIDENEFYNIFNTPIREEAESSTHNVDNSNMHTFYQRHQSEHRWTKDHRLEQVRENPSKPVQTRRQLATDLELSMFALTVSTAKPKNIKEAMADSAWIEAMQDELYQFDRLQVWELVNKPFSKKVIKLKWLWKNKKNEDQTVIRNKE